MSRRVTGEIFALTLGEGAAVADRVGVVGANPNRGWARDSHIPWHPHRGFETVIYIVDGEVSHHDSNGGGGARGTPSG